MGGGWYTKEKSHLFCDVIGKRYLAQKHRSGPNIVQEVGKLLSKEYELHAICI